jgi:hypothetical protein
MTWNWRVLPWESTTLTTSPIWSLCRFQKTAGLPPGRSRCPLITALPFSPGRGPPLYHPTSFHGLCVGVARSLFGRTPTDSIGASTPIAGMSKCPTREGVGLAAEAVSKSPPTLMARASIRANKDHSSLWKRFSVFLRAKGRKRLSIAALTPPRARITKGQRESGINDCWLLASTSRSLPVLDMLGRPLTCAFRN